HGLPPGTDPIEARRFPEPGRYQSNIPLQVTLDPGIRKPNPAVLLAVLQLTGTAPQETLLVGDSISRDIRMAKECGVWDVYARYGGRINPLQYGELLKITYWSQSDVIEQETLAPIEPTFTIDGFRDVTNVIESIEAIPHAYVS
ncbi:MAG: HAD family hydrolase, partial [Gammaproteobacteria bacterium]